MRKKLLSFVLAAVMTLALVPTMTATVFAALPAGSIIADVYFYELVLERMGKPFGYVITPEDASAFEYLDVSVTAKHGSSRRIKSLAGIEYFTGLKTLACRGNYITELDVSKNTKLTSIDCRDNYLTRLDVGNLPQLQYLNCDNNRLTTLNLSGSKSLESIGAGNNRLTSMDVTGLSNLRILNVHENYIQSLDDIVGVDTTLLKEDGFVRVLLDRQNPISAREAALNADAAEIARIAAIQGPDAVLPPYEHNLKMYQESGVKQAAIELISGGELEFAQEIVVLAQSITQGITGDRAKAEAIHAWIAENIAYNYDWYMSFIEPIFTDPVDVLEYRYTICDGYARLNAALLGAAGIPAVYASGDPAGSGEGHAWNELYIDGRWIISDVTNDGRNKYEDAKFSEQRLGGYDRFDLTLEWLSARFRLRGYSIVEVKEPPDRPDPLDSASPWAREGIQGAIGKGFVPDHLKNNYTSVITRKEFCYVAIRWLMYAIDGGLQDITGGTYGRDGGLFQDISDVYVRSAYDLYITSGTSSNTFSPTGLITREQAAVMLMNTCKAAGIDVSNTASAGFSDIDEASAWAVDAINFVRNAGVMSGVGGDRFDPKALYTREQSILTFSNVTLPKLLPRGEPNPAYEYRVIGNTVTILGYLGENYTGDFDTEITIPSTIEGRPVTVIGNRAFDSHKHVERVTIPDSVTAIDRLAFAGCINLTSVYFEGDAPALGDLVFDRCAPDFTVYYRAERAGWSNPWNGYPAAAR